MATPVLYHIEVSHYNEKARWALDYKGVPHRRKAPMPMAHMAWAMAMTRGQSKTFPILKMNGDTIHDSTQDHRAAGARLPGAAPLSGRSRTTAAARSSSRSSSTRSSGPTYGAQPSPR